MQVLYTLAITYTTKYEEIQYDKLINTASK